MDMKIYFFRSINILNLLLLSIAAAIAYFTFIPFFYLDVRMSIPEVKDAPAASVEEPAASQGPSPADYAVISNQNLFHPERRIPPEIKAETVIPKPEVVLYGTLITKESYSLGYQFGQYLKKQEFEIDLDVYTAAIQDALGEKKPLLTNDEIRLTISELQKKVVAAEQREQKEKAAKNLADGKAFLAKNKKRMASRPCRAACSKGC